MTSPDKICIKTYVTPEEYKEICGLAARANLSASKYLSKAALGEKIRSTVDQKAVLDLLKVSADLGRIGGLLKFGLSQEKLPEIEAKTVLDSILETKKILEKKVDDIKI
jgi:hypothetical protein